MKDYILIDPDNDEVKKLQRKWNKTYPNEKGFSPFIMYSDIIIYVEDNGIILGGVSALIYPKNKSSYCQQLTSKKKGLGTYLINKLLEYLKSIEYKTMYADCVNYVSIYILEKFDAYFVKRIDHLGPRMQIDL